MRHTPSFFVSVAIHLVFAAVAFYIYKYAFIVAKKASEEKKVCVSLKCIHHEDSKQVEKKQKVEKKSKKTPVKKVKKQTKQIKKLKKTPKKEQKKSPPKVIKQQLELPKTDKVSKPLTTPVQQQPKEVVISEVKSLTKPVVDTKPLEQKSSQDLYLDKHIAKIQKLLSENLYYPRRARKRGIEGVVKVHFHLNKQGEVSAIEILSSKYDVLSRAAVQTLQNLSGEFPKPDEELELNVPIHYSLKR